jgi:DNA modification methylase
MTAPFYTDDWLTLYGGDCREVLASLPADSVDCVVTSPPYWGLRDYGNDGQLGLERTPEEYVANMVAVFREVRRVLKPSGTCWLNLGDSYAGGGNGGGGSFAKDGIRTPMAGTDKNKRPAWKLGGNQVTAGLKPKDLVGIPWRVAFALQADGWYLRSDIIWSKPNPMPESVTDRPTKAHEYLFLLTKSPRYFFDADAVREPNVEPTGNGGWQNAIRQGDPDRYQGRYTPNKTEGGAGGSKFMRGEHVHTGGRNIRSVWNIATRPYPGAHFAVFPPELPERCIKAGSSEKGVCPECGAPWERVVEKSRTFESGSGRAGNLPIGKNGAKLQGGGETGDIRRGPVLHTETKAWRPTCDHSDGDLPACPECDPSKGHHFDDCPVRWIQPAVILDPFGGSGTVGMVANRLSRRAILIDLNPEYLKQQMRRNAQTPLGLTEGDAA